MIGIGDGAFADQNLTSVTISANIKIIGDNVFKGNKLSSVTIPDSVTTIGNSAFKNNKLTSLTIPDSVTSIDASAFSNNELTSVKVPDSITSVNSDVFSNNKLKDITVPNSVTNIAKNAFTGNELDLVSVPNANAKIDVNAFDSDVVVNPKADTDTNFKFDISGKEATITGFKDGKATTSLDIPKTIIQHGREYNVTTIADNAFKDDKIENGGLPDFIKKVGANSFKNGNRVTVTAEESNLTYTFNGDHTAKATGFKNGQKTTDLVIPQYVVQGGVKYAVDGVKYAMVYADGFSSQGLTSLNLPNGFKTIDGTEFSGNVGLRSLYLPDTVTNVGPNAFMNGGLGDVYISRKTSYDLRGGYNSFAKGAAPFYRDDGSILGYYNTGHADIHYYD